MSEIMLNFLGNTLANGSAVPQVVSAANPLPVTLSGGISGLAVAGTIGDGLAVGAQFPVTVGGVDYATGLIHRVSTDASGNVNVNVISGGGSSIVQQGAGNTANPWTVQGPVANNVAASGNPVPVGGIYQTAGTLTALTVGVAATTQFDPTGNLRVALTGRAFTLADALSNVAVQAYMPNTNNSSGMVNVAGMTFNGLTWDRTGKPRTSFKLPSSAASNNAANIKTTPGTIYSISGNVTLVGSTCYLKLFDTTGVPNPAALAQLYLFPLNIIDAVFSFNLPAGGLYFPTGIGIAIVANPADLDNTAIAAGQITALSVSFF